MRLDALIYIIPITVLDQFIEEKTEAQRGFLHLLKVRWQMCAANQIAHLWRQLSHLSLV